MDDQMAAILANLESGLAATEADESPLAAFILNLSSSDALQQEKAIREIINATLREEDRIYVTKRDGAAPIIKLVKEGSKPILRSLGAHALANLALNRDARAAVARDGGLRVLCAALADSDDGVKERALAALCNLSVAEDDLRLTIVREGGTSKALQILTVAHDSALISAALMLIANISVNVQVAGQVVHDNGVPVVGKFMASGDPAHKRLAIFALSALSCNPASHSQLERFISDLGHALSGADAEAERKVMIALVNLSGSSTAGNEFIRSGIIPHVGSRIDSSQPDLQAFALQLVQNLAISDLARPSLDSAGVPARVTGVLKGNNPALIPHALRATTNLCCDGNIRRSMNQQGPLQAVERWNSSSDPTIRDAAGQASINLKA